jgi:hypothetical protein
VLYGLLGVIDIFLLVKYAKKGPERDLSSIIYTQEALATGTTPQTDKGLSNIINVQERG